MSEPITIQKLIEASMDSDSLEVLVNGDENAQVTTRLGETYPSAKKAIRVILEQGTIDAKIFDTKALMIANSTLANGDYALVVSDKVHSYNGYYKKVSDGWNYLDYNMVSTAKKYIKSIVDDKPDFLDFTIIDAYIDNDTGNSLQPSFGSLKSAIIKVKPSTKYTIQKDVTSRFRIMGYNKFPDFGVASTQEVKKEDYGSLPSSDTYGNKLHYYTFTTSATTTYVATYFSGSADPKTPEMQIKEGGLFEFTGNLLNFSKDVEFNGNTISNSIQKKMGKNIFNGEYVRGFLSGNPELGDVAISNSSISSVAIVPIKGSTTYTVSKTKSDRFKIGLSNVRPTVGALIPSITLLTGDELKDSLVQTFTSRPTDTHAIIYVASTSEPPIFMQVEEGAKQTTWEKYGYDISIASPYEGGASNGVASAGVGNAKYIERGSAKVYTDSTKMVEATDDSDALQELFNAGGIIQLDSNKIYAVSKPLVIDLRRVKYINGNGSTIVTISDGIVLDIFGTKTTDAGPNMATGISMQEAGEVIHNLKVTSASGLIGQGVRVRNTFKLELDIQCYFMREGVVLEGHNRNIRLRPKVYAMQTNCLRFSENSNLHQGQVYIADMSYANKLVFMDNAEVYNVQFVGGDIETGKVWKDVTTKESIDQHSVIHIRASTKIVNDISFTGLTIESHYIPERLVKIEGGASKLVRYVQFNGCFYGNSSKNGFEVGGVKSLRINGISDSFPNNFIEFDGDCENVDIDVNLSRSSGFIKSVGAHTLDTINAKVTGTELKGVLIDLDCNLDGFKLSKCVTKNISTTGLSASKGLVSINTLGRTIDMVDVSDNTFKLPNNVTHIVNVTGEPTGRVKVQGNDSNKSGVYPTTSANISSTGNYAP